MRERGPLEWTRFSFNDFFDDPAVCAMGDHFVGPYMRLLHAAYRASNPGHLPNDNEWLRAQARLSPEAWEIFSPLVQRAFKITPKHWIQKRVVKEYNHVKTISRQNSAAGKVSAARRKASTGVERLSTIRLDVDETRQDRRILESRIESEPIARDLLNVNGHVKTNGAFSEGINGVNRTKEVQRQIAALARAKAL